MRYKIYLEPTLLETSTTDSPLQVGETFMIEADGEALRCEVTAVSPTADDVDEQGNPVFRAWARYDVERGVVRRNDVTITFSPPSVGE